MAKSNETVTNDEIAEPRIVKDVKLPDTHKGKRYCEAMGLTVEKTGAQKATVSGEGIENDGNEMHYNSLMPFAEGYNAGRVAAGLPSVDAPKGMRQTTAKKHDAAALLAEATKDASPEVLAALELLQKSAGIKTAAE